MSSRSRQNRSCVVGMVFVALFCMRASAQLEISVSPTPVGSGARAAGMADAFVAIADDATAASWNPAGLVQLERPEISIVGAYNGIAESFKTRNHEEMESDHQTHNFDLNYLSAAYPLPVLLFGRNATVSLNYQRKYDFSRKFDLRYDMQNVLSTGTVVNRMLRQDFEQEGGLSTLTPAFAMEITKRISVGVSLNFWRSSFLGENSWRQDTRTEVVTLRGSSMQVDLVESREEYEDFSGENATLGVLWSITDKWSVGARYDTAFTGEADYTREGYAYSIPLAGTPGGVGIWPSETRDPRFIRKEKRHIRFPDSIALGAAYRANDRLTLSLDVTRTDWNDFYMKDADGYRFSLIDRSRLDEPWAKPHFDPTYTVRFGVEYVCLPRQPEETLNRLWSLRGGLFYDEEAASARPNPPRFASNLLQDQGSGEPDKFYGVALGVGLLTHQRVNIDAAYQLRYGPGVNGDFIRDAEGFREDVFQHRFLLSTVIYF